ncbi:MAG: MFS transporter [Thermoleophilia bacterium]|nr:MFS transporter [Thermoleophilia bacterium]
MRDGGMPGAAVAALAAACALVPLNSSMVTLALLDVEADLGVPVSRAVWLVTGYLAVMALAQPLGGRLGDAAGHRRTFLAGFAVFVVCSVLAAAAPGFAVLVAARAGQAVGGALMLPSVAAIIRNGVRADRRGRAFGVLATALALSAAVGPTVGGVVTGVGGWRAVFLVPVPLGLLALPVLLRIPAVPATHEDHSGDAARALAVLTRRPFALGSAAILLHNLVLYTVLLTVPVLATAGLGLGAGTAGVLAGAVTAGVLLGSLRGGRMSDRHGRRRPALLGGAIAAAGGAPLPLVAGHPSVWALVPPLLVLGTGIGLAGPALQAAALDAAPPEAAAVAGGLYMSARYVGGILAGLVASAALEAGGEVRLLAVAAAGAALSAAAAAGLPGSPRRGSA